MQDETHNYADLPAPDNEQAAWIRFRVTPACASAIREMCRKEAELKGKPSVAVGELFLNALADARPQFSEVLREKNEWAREGDL